MLQLKTTLLLLIAYFLSTRESPSAKQQKLQILSVLQGKRDRCTTNQLMGAWYGFVGVDNGPLICEYIHHAKIHCYRKVEGLGHILCHNRLSPVKYTSQARQKQLKSGKAILRRWQCCKCMYGQTAINSQCSTCTCMIWINKMNLAIIL